VTVTGVLGRVDGYFAIFPRNDADITRYGSLPTFSLPFDVSKSATQSRDPDIVSGANGELFMAWGRVHHESVHSLSLDHTQNWSIALPIMHQGVQPALAVTSVRQDRRAERRRRCAVLQAVDRRRHADGSAGARRSTATRRAIRR
jgi:hypothetical protein